MPEIRHKAEIYVNYDEAQTRQNLSSGEEIRTVFGKIKKWFADMGTAAFKDVPSSGDAGNSEVVLGNDSRLSDARTPTAHNQAANTITAMTGYTKPQSTAAVSASDTLNGAIGKLEKALDGKGTSNFSGDYADLSNKPTLGTAAAKDVPASGNASTSQVVMGNDTRLSDSRPASDVSSWAKASTKPTYTASEVGAAPESHTQPSSTITAMTGYSKPQSTSAIAATDTLNEAIGKLEKGLDGAGTPNDGVLTIQQNGNIIGTFSANQASNETINIQAISTIMTSSAVNTSDGTTTIEERKTNVSITDSISYSNLATGSTYTLKTRVYDATTGNYLSITKDGVTSTEISTTITPTANNGAYINTFSIDSIVGVEAGTLIGVDEVLEGTSTGAVSFLTVTETPKVYGFKINKNDTNPDTRVEYMYDAIGMTPAYMDFTNGTFNYGSWGNVWFISENRPVALKYDGTVDYELDHTDFTKKLDGTASDVSDSSYAGNFMSEMPTVYVKRWEDSSYNYMAFSQVKIDNDYLAQAHTNANGVVNSHIYLPMFKGSVDSNNKMRSLMGTYPKGDTTGSNEVTYASNCGSGWQLWDKAKIDLIMDLIVLITKSTNCRAKIGNGDCNTYNSSDTTNYGKMKSGYETNGSTRSTNAQFYGYESTETTNYGKHHMIAFYIEDMWGNRFDRCLGFNLVNNVYKVKMTPPYALNTDSTYTTLNVSPPSSTDGWLKNVSSGTYGDVPTEVGASNTTGFACYFYKNTSGTKLALFSGAASRGLKVGRSWDLDSVSSYSSWAIGGSPCYNPL